MRFLNSREKKVFFNQLAEQYGYSGSTDFVVFEKGKHKYYVATADTASIDLIGLRPAHLGLYAVNEMHDELRLTMDGAQLFGPACTHPPVMLSEEQAEVWMRGEDVPVEDEDGPFCIVQCGEDILGCGKIKKGYLLNYVPKGRWILDPH